VKVFSVIEVQAGEAGFLNHLEQASGLAFDRGQIGSSVH
jgi:hypothetical protein